MSRPRVAIIIPARYGSTRLPGKPLLDIAGKPMIQRVYEQAIQVPDVDEVIVATDDVRVADAVHRFGGVALMTSADHVSGTDRLVEVAGVCKADVYLNVQGDEPLIRPADLGILCKAMSDTTVRVATLCHPIDAFEARSPSSVKVVLDDADDALYFSRSPIPYPRNAEAARYLKHLGVYAYRADVLRAYSCLRRPMLEDAEVLEQLRLMAAGIRLRVLQVEPAGPGVDTEECLARVRAIVEGRPDALSVTERRASPELADIRLVITDVDGVLTDGTLYYSESGECQKRFHVRDGLGISLLQAAGVQVAVASGRDSGALRKRIADLGIKLHCLGVSDKAAACRDLMATAGVSAYQTAFVGDDSIDLPAFGVCGLSFAVADAPGYVKSAATIVLDRRGGAGALREVSDRLLSAAGKAGMYSTAAGYASATCHTLGQ